MSDDGTTVLALPEDDVDRFGAALKHVQEWCAEHQWQVGVAEMAVGAALVAAGLQTGALQMGADVVVTTFSEDLTARFFGGGAGTVLGALPGFVLGNIGVAAVGGAIAIPALLLMGGGSLILGLAGYGTGQLIEQFLHPVPSLFNITMSASLAVIGAALFIDGAQRISRDPDVKSLASSFKNGALHLGRVAYESSIDSIPALQHYYAAQLKPFLEDLATDPRSAATTIGLTAAGLLGGQAIAVASVTALGSGSLGALGLSLGFLSAPLWPVFAGGGLALAAAYGVWYVSKRSGSLTTMLPPSSTPPALPNDDKQ